MESREYAEDKIACLYLDSGVMYCNMSLLQTSFISSTLVSSAEISHPRGLHNILYFVPRGAGRFCLEVSLKFKPCESIPLNRIQMSTK